MYLLTIGCEMPRADEIFSCVMPFLLSCLTRADFNAVIFSSLTTIALFRIFKNKLAYNAIMEKYSAVIEKYSLNKHTWVKKGLHTVLHTMYPATINLLKPLNDYFGDSFRLFVFFVIDDYLHWYYNEQDMTRLREKVVDKIIHDSSFLLKLESDWRKREKLFLASCMKMDNSDTSSLSDSQLLSLYTEFYDAYVAEYALAMGLLESFSMQANTFLKPMLEENAKISSDDYNMLISPVEQSFISFDYLGRLAIMKDMKKGKNTDKMIEEHARKFHWVENNYAKVKNLDAAYFRQKITDEINLGINPDDEIKKEKERSEHIKSEKKKLIKSLKLGEKAVSLINAVEVFAKMQDDRKKCVLISNSYQKKFLHEIGKRSGFSDREMDYTIFPEMESVLQGRFDKDVLYRRMKASLCIEKLDKAVVFDSDIALGVFKNAFEKDVPHHEIKGMCASPGKARGTAKIILKVHDLVSVDAGDIIVTSMTRPDMIVALKKAKGIITDEGGVTSHAAVISREMGIPCIIGTKHATSIIKNGDLVELDTDKGIARIVK